MKQRTALIFGFIALTAFVFAGFVVYRVQSNLEPAPDTAPKLQQGSNGSPTLTEEVVLDGLDHVWDLAFLPDGTLLFTERSGTISRLADGEKAEVHNVSDIYARGEGGLMGLAVDPEYEKNNYIYACYSTEEDIRVTRWKLGKSLEGLSEKKNIISGIPVNTTFYPGRHSGCRIAFGPDGYLWVGTGDAATGENPQDPQSLGGKILRVSREGEAARGNIGGEFDDRVYSYGHRNIQGLAFYDSPRDGSYGFSVEHGPDKDDEINRLVKGNMGWNPVPIYNELVPMTDKEQYPDAIEPIWASGDSTIAPSGMTIITGRKWKNLEGRLALAVLKNKHIRLVELSDEVEVESEELLFTNQYGRIRSVVMGPKNNLYFSTDNGEETDKIVRVTPS